LNTLIKTLVLAATAFAVATMSGCAVIPGTAEMNYTPMAHAQHVQNAGAVAVKVTGGKEDRVVSHKLDTFAIEMASIKLDKPINDAVSEALSQELTSRGYTVNTASTTPLLVTVEKFACKIHQGFFGHYVSEVALNVHVNNYSASVVGNGEATNALSVGSADTTRDSLNLATKDAKTKLFADPAFIAAISNK
jgi:uncharacterized lipoprotein YajG